ncbi:MAG: GGDEF domain-containing protein [Rhodospirillales bacterium]|nr:GGDEF domain-containing protein [Rhodospirillales bacterium]
MENESTYAVLMLDIDYFKQVNDNYGHVAGDAGILHVVRKIRQQLTANARLGRFGGEEFVVFLIQDNVGDSPEEPPIQQLAETIRQSITEKPLNFNGQEIALAASIGVTTCRSGEQPGEALSRADQALYKAKESGRNRVCFQ